MSYSSAWEMLLALRGLDWAAIGTRRVGLGSVIVDIAADGHWQSNSPLAAEEEALLDSLLPLVTRPGPLVIGQLGQSLDGRIATASGDSWYINGPVARTHLHRLRALVDAVLVGAGTAAGDLPALTVRHVTGPDPVAVILDPRGRVEPIGPLFERQAGQPAVIHLVGPGLDLPAAPVGVERLVVATDGDGRVCPRAVIRVLAERGLKRLLVEGGGVTVSHFVQADCLDHLHLLIAPLIIGSGRPGLALPPIDRLSQARRPPIRSFRLGDELLVDVRFR
ncbi:MAG: RibD family protein [Wenzhouxiangella sp.]